jgi:glyoxylate/hydroxypyruvate reductase A
VVDLLVASWLDPGHVDQIRAAAPEVAVHYAPELLPLPRYPCDHTGPARELSPADLERWQQLLARADIAFDADWWRPAEMPRSAPNLRWVQMTSAGIGAFLARTGLDRSPITFTTAAGVHGVPLAEFVVTGLLQLIKGMATLSAWQSEHHWERHATGQLRGRRALVVGLGGIGREVVRVLDALGVQVTGLGRAGRSYDVPGLAGLVGVDSLDAVVGDFDVVVLACPLTEDTRNLLSADRISRLSASAIVVNIARGAVLDEAALTDALARKAIAGAVLDVFATEPLPASSPLWDLDNVVVSPHSASTVEGENDRLVDLFCDNLRRWLDGSPLLNVFDAQRGY